MALQSVLGLLLVPALFGPQIPQPIMLLVLFLFIIYPVLCSQYGASAFASPSIPPPPPLSVPVWSLSADEDLPSSMQGRGNTRHSMNIVTFATAVSVAPPKIWAVSLYTNTLTRRAFLDAKVGVLQLLRPDQSKLVPILGKRSGYEDGYDKREECKVAGFEWVAYHDGNNDDDLDESTGICTCSSEGDADYGDTVRLQVLPGCATYIKLKVLSYHNAGDHDVALCEVLDTAMWNDDAKKVVSCSSDSKEGKPTVPAFDPSTALYTGQLREEGII